MKPLVIYHHLGFGDHLICNAIVRACTRGRTAILLCLPEYLPSVRYLYNKTDICVIPIPVGEHQQATERNGQKMCAMFEECGFEVRKFGYLGDPAFSHENFARVFYRQAGLPYDKMRKDFAYPYDLSALTDCPTPRERFLLLHEYETATRKFLIDRSRLPEMPTVVVDKRVSPERTNPTNLFGVAPLFWGAEQIHCIWSWMVIMIELVAHPHPDLRKRLKGRLFLHRYARPDANFGFNCELDWTILD